MKYTHRPTNTVFVTSTAKTPEGFASIVTRHQGNDKTEVHREIHNMRSRAQYQAAKAIKKVYLEFVNLIPQKPSPELIGEGQGVSKEDG